MDLDELKEEADGLTPVERVAVAKILREVADWLEEPTFSPGEQPPPQPG